MSFLDRVVNASCDVINFNGQKISASDLAARSCFDDHELFRGQSVLVMPAGSLNAALILLELDGIAKRMIVCPPNLEPSHLAEVARAGSATIAVCDSQSPPAPSSINSRIEIDGLRFPRQASKAAGVNTEWVLLTSGTTGVPKLVCHDFASLTANIRRPASEEETIVWASFNDLRRFSGLQMFLHSLLTNSTLVLKPHDLRVSDFIPVLEQTRASHVSGTPTHWRKVLMYPNRRALNLRQITLVGEIADQPLLDALKNAYPQARITHIYGSTEAGTGFSVHDGQAGFPASYIGKAANGLEMVVDNGMLKLRSNRAGHKYIGESIEKLRDDRGFIETGDIVQLNGDRYRFLGRKSGTVNIGGSHVHPEEVEAALNADPRVAMSAVKARKNPFTGSILVADVMLVEPAMANLARDQLAASLIAGLRSKLEPYKVPATISFVTDIAVANSGKLERTLG